MADEASSHKRDIADLVAFYKVLIEMYRQYTKENRLYNNTEENANE